MGTDIEGVIECHGPSHAPPESRSWRFAVDLELLYDDRHYDAFGCLFGVRNHAGFRPVARPGFPKDAAAGTRAAFDVTRAGYPRWTEGDHHPSRLTWRDVTLIDWDERASRPDDRITVYERTADGTLVRRYKASWGREFDDLDDLDPEHPLEGARNVGVFAVGGEPRPLPAAGREWIRGDKVYRAEVLRRRDAISARDRWHDVFDVMRVLAQVYGDDGVRLVVWFDG